MLVDSHCHLDFDSFDDDLNDVMQRARNAGVAAMLTIGTRLDRFDRVRALADRFDDVWCTVGVHPHEAADYDGLDVEALIELATHPRVVGIGETGLDYYYEHSPREAQQRLFQTHIEAAQVTGLPVVVHTRDADADTMRILAEAQAKKPFTGVIHCFSSGAQLAQQALDLGLYISISGIITFKQAEALRETVRHLPLERLLVETDAPYLAPMPKRGKRNEPAFVVHTANRLAELLQVPGGQVVSETSRNFLTLFNKIDLGPS